MFHRNLLRCAAATFQYVPLFPKVTHKDVKYRLLTNEFVSVAEANAGLP